MRSLMHAMSRLCGIESKQLLRSASTTRGGGRDSRWLAGGRAPITHRRDAQRTLLTTAGLGDVSPSRRQGSIGLRAHLLGQSRKLPLELVLEAAHAPAIYSGTAAVSPDTAKRAAQVAHLVDFIDQAELFSSFHSSFEGRGGGGD